jgi:hypothetical protein
MVWLALGGAFVVLPLGTILPAISLVVIQMRWHWSHMLRSGLD